MVGPHIPILSRELLTECLNDSVSHFPLPLIGLAALTVLKSLYNKQSITTIETQHVSPEGTGDKKKKNLGKIRAEPSDKFLTNWKTQRITHFRAPQILSQL